MSYSAVYGKNFQKYWTFSAFVLWFMFENKCYISTWCAIIIAKTESATCITETEAATCIAKTETATCIITTETCITA